MPWSAAEADVLKLLDRLKNEQGGLRLGDMSAFSDWYAKRPKESGEALQARAEALYLRELKDAVGARTGLDTLTKQYCDIMKPAREKDNAFFRTLLAPLKELDLPALAKEKPLMAALRVYQQYDGSVSKRLRDLLNRAIGRSREKVLGLSAVQQAAEAGKPWACPRSPTSSARSSRTPKRKTWTTPHWRR